ncbi:MAG: 2-oxo acid dehydrogenase subunit E2 [Spirochaetota bacterium]
MPVKLRISPQGSSPAGDGAARGFLPLSAILDHRVVDGSMGGKRALSVQKYLSRPELLLEKPEEP